MLYTSVATFTTLNSILAVVLLCVYCVMRLVYGAVGYADRINALARTKKITAIEIYAYVALVAWFVFVFPWFDAVVLGWFTHVEDGRALTYFGMFTSDEEVGDYFLLVCIGIVGVKMALLLTIHAGRLRKGHIIIPTEVLLQHARRSS